jgi:hypothetical protein
MSNLSQFFGGGGIKPTAMVHGTLPTPVTAHRNENQRPANIEAVDSGACTAGTLKTILSVTGRGALTYLDVGVKDTTSRTSRLRVTIDGTVVYDETNSAAAAAKIVVALGAMIDTYNGQGLDGVPLLFDASLRIEYASSLTEINKASIGYIYYER